MICALVVLPDSPRPAEAEGLGHAVTVTAGPLDPAAQRRALDELARAAPDVLWIAWAALAPPDPGAIRRFRVAAPRTRIVVELPEDLTPPDPAVAELVAMGVYDLVRPGLALAEALARRPVYADVVAWHGGVPDAEPAPARMVERVERVAISQRPVLVAVVGATPGAGATTTAVALARTLAERGHGVALVEVGPPALADWPDLPGGVDVYPQDAGETPGGFLRQRRWPYVVGDYGAGTAAWTAARADAPDLTVVVGPGLRARHSRWADILAALDADRPEGIVVLGLVGGDAAPPTDAWPVLPLPPPAGRDAEAVWREVLAPVLPDARPRRTWWAPRRARVARADPAPPGTPPGSGSAASAAPVVIAAPPPVVVRPRRSPLAPLGTAWRVASDVAYWLVVAAIVGLVTWVAGQAAAAGLLGHGWAQADLVRLAAWEERVAGALLARLAGRRGA